MLNLYKVLDINPTASQSEVVSASEKLIAEWDPSKIQDRKNRAIVAGVLKEIIEARDVLSDRRKRREYDVSIGLAKIVYKGDFKSKQTIQNRQSGRVDDKILGHSAIIHSEETDSEAEEFYDSNSELNSDKEKTALNVNRQEEGTSSNKSGEVLKNSNAGVNTAESLELKFRHSSKDTLETPIKSFEKADASSSERVLGNPPQSADRNQTSNNSDSLFVKNSKFQNKTQKTSETFPSNDHSVLDATKTVKSASNNKFSVINTVSDVVSTAKSVLSNVKDGISSKSIDLNAPNDNITSMTAKHQKESGNKSSEDPLKQKSEATVDDEYKYQDHTSESYFNSNNNVLPSSKAESKNTLKNKSSEFVNPTKKTKSGNNSKEINVHKMQNLSTSKSEDDSDVVEISDVKGEESLKGKLIDNNIAKSHNQQITPIDYIKDVTASDPSNIDTTTNHQELLPSNKNSPKVGDKIINNTQKPISTNEEKPLNVKSSGSILSRADSVLKQKDEEQSSVHLNKDSKATYLPNAEANYGENSKAKKNSAGLSNKNSDNSNDSIVVNSSVLKTSSENADKNTFDFDNEVETENGSVSTEKGSNVVLSKVFSRILQNSKEKEVSSKDQNNLKSSVTRKKRLENTINDPDVDLRQTSEYKSTDSIQQTKDSQSKSKLHTQNTVVNNKQQTADDSISENSNLKQGKELKSNLFDTHQTSSSSEIFSSETVWRRDEQSNQEKVNSTSKKPNPSQDPIHMKSVSASTISRGSETKTLYFYGPESERVEVYVDGKLRVQIAKGESEDSYTSDWHNSASPTTTKNIRALTTIEANGAKIKTLRICDGKQETISVHKDHVLMCRVSSKIN